MEAKTTPTGRFMLCILVYVYSLTSSQNASRTTEMEAKTAPLGCFISVYFNIGSLFYLYFIARILLIKREIFLAAVFFLITPR